MQKLTHICRRLRTSSVKVRKICESLDIEIFKVRGSNYIHNENVERIETELESSRHEPVSNTMLIERIERARRAKEAVCGDDTEMSYARFSDQSDVYIYRSGDVWICNGCKLKKRYDSEHTNLTSLKQHINEHTEAGHRIPYYTLERIDYEIENGVDIWGQAIERNLIGQSHYD